MFSLFIFYQIFAKNLTQICSKFQSNFAGENGGDAGNDGKTKRWEIVLCVFSLFLVSFLAKTLDSNSLEIPFKFRWRNRRFLVLALYHDYSIFLKTKKYQILPNFRIGKFCQIQCSYHSHSAYYVWFPLDHFSMEWTLSRGRWRLDMNDIDLKWVRGKSRKVC